MIFDISLSDIGYIHKSYHRVVKINLSVFPGHLIIVGYGAALDLKQHLFFSITFLDSLL